jgi:hypothetical protein
MARFLVLQEIWIADRENGPSCDEPGYETVAGFGTLIDADEYIAAQARPEDFHVEDQDDEHDMLASFEDMEDFYRDSAEDDADLGDEEDLFDDDDRLHEDDCC